MLELLDYINWNFTVLLAIAGALILYFGKVIADTKVEHYEKTNIYIAGLFFTLVYIFLPFVFAYQLYKELTIPLFIFYLPILLIYSFLLTDTYINEYFVKLDVRDRYKKKYREKLESIKKSGSKAGKLVNSSESFFSKKTGEDYTNLPIDALKTVKKLVENKYLLMVFSFIFILFLLYAIKEGNQSVIIISIIITFFGLTMVAIAFGYKDVYYPRAKISLDSGEFIEGKIIKFGDYLFVMDGDIKRFINRDKIKTVEFSKYKTKEDSDKNE